MNWYMHTSMSLYLDMSLSILLWMTHSPSQCPWFHHTHLHHALSCSEIFAMAYLSFFSFKWSSFCFMCLTENFLSSRSVQFSCLVMSDSLRPHESQHARHPCPSPTPRVYRNSRPLSQWCHPIISSSVIPFSSCPQTFPASGSFQMNQLFS